MSDETPSVVLEHLRHIRGRVDQISEDVHSLNLRMTGLERQMPHSYSGHVDQNDEIDRLKRRVDKIERRLDLDE